MEGKSLSVEELDICFQDITSLESGNDTNISSSMVDEEGYEKNGSFSRFGARERQMDAVSKPIDQMNFHVKQTSERLEEKQRIHGQRFKEKQLPQLKIRQKGENAVKGDRETKQHGLWNLWESVRVPSYEDQKIPSSDVNYQAQGKKQLLPLKDRKPLFAMAEGNNKPVNDRDALHLNPVREVQRGTTVASETLNNDLPSIEVQNGNKIPFLCSQDYSRGVAQENALDRRRCSAPLSPRLLGRFKPQRKYSNPAPLENLETSDDGETKFTFPERSKLFSPPSKQFDTLGCDGDNNKKKMEKTSKLMAHSKSKASAPRKSLDLSFEPSSTRFLSEIKVSLPASKSSNELPEGTSGNHFKFRKHNYQPSTEPLTHTALPGLELSRPRPLSPRPSSPRPLSPRPLSPCSFGQQQDSRPRSAHVQVGRMPGRSGGRGEDDQFSGAMFLDVEAERLSHLNLSPRPARKR